MYCVLEILVLLVSVLPIELQTKHIAKGCLHLLNLQNVIYE